MMHFPERLSLLLVRCLFPDFFEQLLVLLTSLICIGLLGYPDGRDRSTARLTLGVGLAVSAFPLSVPV
ncbi:MAG: hypothetical protein JRI73_09010 [Deltaproteobacteria bacterium]|nr:hypothetical protein [Deltaproteobacteria bacterium]